MSGRETNLTKNTSPDRIIVLKPVGGKNILSAQGMTDNRLFTGDNQLHARMDPEYGHWFVQYEKGIPSEPLRQRWTSFSKLLVFVTEYYKRRNIQVIEIIDT